MLYFVVTREEGGGEGGTNPLFVVKEEKACTAAGQRMTSTALKVVFNV